MLNASDYVYEALRDGRLVRQPCETCGRTPAQAHHDDYSRPLDVRWLCGSHHRLEHSPGIMRLSENVKVKIDPDMKRRLEQEAKLVDRPVGSVIRLAIRAYLAEKS